MSGLEALILKPQEAGAMAPAWQALAERAVAPNPFFAPSFLLPYLAHLDRRPAVLVAVREKGADALLAAAPFQHRRPGLLIGAATAAAGDYGPLGTPLLAPGALAGAPADALAGALALLVEAAAGHFRKKIVVFPYLRTDDAVAASLSEAAGARGWHLAFDDPQVRAGHAAGEAGRAQFESVAKGRLKELGRQFRRLSDLAETRFAGTSDPAELPQAFERFLHLEAKGWKGGRGSALSSSAQTAAFARAFVAAAAARGALRIDELIHAGQPVAMLVSIRDGARLFAWKTAYDEAFARFSPGAQLAREAMRLTLAEEPATEDGRDGDSLAIPGHPMISPLWRGAVPYATAIVATSKAGAARLAADMAARRRLKQAAKAVVKRVRG
ncbi:GNAT family N-acetyltransferase [Stappia sp. F7233]|uniref:GNAT family N-acetyltransferase n=1 Tax=Stappia albiluteola TaxID=2758565 RepID=A0A839AI09_9HYPH|nr:GNAT family N-acetyltransferase [Stappia albiluteola]MBA5778552.1 GNAT family N-acetyltransferase [Stappia albiluteola]